jgi:hypothetical protein
LLSNGITASGFQQDALNDELSRSAAALSWLKAEQHDYQNYQEYDRYCQGIGFREIERPADEFEYDVDNDEANHSDDDQPADQP